MEYIYAHNRIWTKAFVPSSEIQPVNGMPPYEEGGGYRCQQNTLIAYDVQCAGRNNIMDANTWTFKIKGHGDTVYKTHYAWSLVANTEANRALLAERQALHVERRKIERRLTENSGRLTTIKDVQ